MGKHKYTVCNNHLSNRFLKYWVRDKNGNALLVRKWGSKDDRYIPCLPFISPKIQEKRKGFYTITKQEIKDYDERYWAFAVPMEK